MCRNKICFIVLYINKKCLLLHQYHHLSYLGIHRKIAAPQLPFTLPAITANDFYLFAYYSPVSLFSVLTVISLMSDENLIIIRSIYFGVERRLPRTVVSNYQLPGMFAKLHYILYFYLIIVK
jgi:hypothetical protein